MISKTEFEKILEVEQRAVEIYTNILDQVQDAEVREKIEVIRQDEIEHVRLAERMLELIA